MHDPRATARRNLQMSNPTDAHGEVPPSGSPTVSDEPISAGGAGSPTVLVAVEDDEASVRTLRVAHRLFGDGAHYLAINVGEGSYASMQWAYVYPVTAPGAWYSPAWITDQPADIAEADGRAAAVAAGVADAAGMPSATELGRVGDAAAAILDAAHEHHADVVVIGSHERGWLSRLFSGSVEQDLIRFADFSVLVVK
jgi:nucleotide-binding universal stress UspA family protein